MVVANGSGDDNEDDRRHGSNRDGATTIPMLANDRGEEEREFLNTILLI